MDFNTIWFILIAVLFIGYFILEGFDFGVGILLPFLGKDDRSRRVIINTIGPHWDGNEVSVMHACGHDVHITSLVGTARVMANSKDAWSGTLMLIGQPVTTVTGCPDCSTI